MRQPRHGPQLRREGSQPTGVAGVTGSGGRRPALAAATATLGQPAPLAPEQQKQQPACLPLRQVSQGLVGFGNRRRRAARKPQVSPSSRAVRRRRGRQDRGRSTRHTCGRRLLRGHRRRSFQSRCNRVHGHPNRNRRCQRRGHGRVSARTHRPQHHQRPLQVRHLRCVMPLSHIRRNHIRRKAAQKAACNAHHFLSQNKI